ncbi:hypothetical protein ABIA22_000394 [Sinorhizobium fredii]
MTCHNPDNETVVLAAQWAADQRHPPRPIVPELRSRFPLTEPEAVEAAAMSERFRLYRKVYG